MRVLHHVHQHIRDHTHTQLMVFPHGLQLLKKLTPADPLLYRRAAEQAYTSDDIARYQRLHIPYGDVLKVLRHKLFHLLI